MEAENPRMLLFHFCVLIFMVAAAEASTCTEVRKKNKKKKQKKKHAHQIYTVSHRDFPTFSKQGPGTNDFGKNNTYISQIGKMDTKQNRGYYAVNYSDSEIYFSCESSGLIPSGQAPSPLV